jgi:hypothetical protein
VSSSSAMLTLRLSPPEMPRQLTSPMRLWLHTLVGRVGQSHVTRAHLVPATIHTSHACMTDYTHLSAQP